MLDSSRSVPALSNVISARCKYDFECPIKGKEKTIPNMFKSGVLYRLWLFSTILSKRETLKELKRT
jgi:hypothetical protein